MAVDKGDANFAAAIYATAAVTYSHSESIPAMAVVSDCGLPVVLGAT